MNHAFSSDFFVANRKRLLESLAESDTGSADAPVVIAANGLLQRNGDTTFPYAQDSNFWYLTGINEPDITLVISGGQEFLIVPERSTSREAFDGAIDPAALSQLSGVRTVLGETAGWDRLGRIVRKTDKAGVSLAAAPYIDQYGMYTNPGRARTQDRLTKSNPNIVFRDIRQELAVLRMIKQPPELAAIQQAIDITHHSLQALTDPARFAGYAHEYEIEADLTREFRFRGAAGHAFAPIIAGGRRAVTLHNVRNDAVLQPDSLVILDVGAEVSHYAADITRTLAYGTATSRQRQVYDAVLDAQSYALNLLKPGALLKEYEDAVETYIGKALQRLKLIKTANHDTIRTYYPHAASHFLGLDVHDAGDYKRALQPGMVLTCEPGIYIPEEGIGVRLEDDILITADGNSVLSAALPKALM